MDTKKDKYVEVSLTLRVNGNIVNNKKEKYYTRTLKGSEFTLERFARLLFMYDRIFIGHSTNAYDGLLQEMEKKLNCDGETAASVFNKYWVNLHKTIDDEFNKNNKGSGDYENDLFPEENDYLKYLISSFITGFCNTTLPVKHAFLYWLFKNVMNSSFEEMKTDLKNTPDFIKNIIDQEFTNKK